MLPWMRWTPSHALIQIMRFILLVVSVLLLSTSLLVAQDAPKNSSTPAKSTEDYSGMYSFLKDGEYVQLTIEEGRVTGFISRFGDLESDRGVFLDQFFKEGKLEDKKLSFKTETVHGIWFEFTGAIERGKGKNPGDEAYYVLKGTLLKYMTDANKKISSASYDVAFKSYPQDLTPGPAKRD